MKYFEKNVMHGADYIVLHRHLTKASAVAANNLFFQEGSTTWRAKSTG